MFLIMIFKIGKHKDFKVKIYIYILIFDKKMNFVESEKVMVRFTLRLWFCNCDLEILMWH